MNRLTCFLGKPITINQVRLFSPTIDAIDDIGEAQYNLFLTLASFNKETVFKHLFQLSEEQMKEIEPVDAFELFVAIPVIQEELRKALAFFACETVDYDADLSAYVVQGQVFVDQDNYRDIAKVILEINGIMEPSKEIKFKNTKAKTMYAKLQKLRSKYKQHSADEALGLKDILSILCHVEGNGINVFNVGQLTIYQVYEHFERLNLREQHRRMLKVWANGYLGKEDKLPEWLVQSKL